MSGCEEYDYFKVSVFLQTVSELHSYVPFSVHSLGRQKRNIWSDTYSNI